MSSRFRLINRCWLTVLFAVMSCAVLSSASGRGQASATPARPGFVPAKAKKGKDKQAPPQPPGPPIVSVTGTDAPQIPVPDADKQTKARLEAFNKQLQKTLDELKEDNRLLNQLTPAERALLKKEKGNEPGSETKEVTDSNRLLESLTVEQNALQQKGKDNESKSKQMQDKFADDEKIITPLSKEQQDLLRSGHAIGSTSTTPAAPGLLGKYSLLVPGLSAILSFFAILYFVLAKAKTDRALATQKDYVDGIETSVRSAQTTLNAYTTEQATILSAKAKSGAGRSAQDSAAKASASKSRNEQPAPNPPNVIRPPETSQTTGAATIPADEQTSKVSSPAAQTPPTAPPAPLDPRKSTGDIVADYNRALTMGDEGRDWFKEAYDCFGLSCKNPNDRMLDPNALLIFQQEPRGMFLGVRHKGAASLVPALDRDLAALSPYMQGIFEYPLQASGPLHLFRAALIEESGNLWELRQSGEIKP